MLGRVLLIAILCAGAYVLIRHGRRWSSAASPWQRSLVIAGLVIVLVLALVRGGAEIAAPLLAIVVPLLLRGLGSRRLPDSPSSTADTDSRCSATDPAMTREEAYEVLGLPAGASQEEIRLAHRRLIQRLHPDRGGSAYLAARLNQARRVLLGN